MINRSTPVAIATAVLLAGCSLIPTYERPAAPVAAQYTRANATAAAEGGTAAAQLPWQDFFQDARLQQLVRTALDNNRDLRVAALNIERAQAQYRITRADQFPTVGAGVNASRAPNTTGSGAKYVNSYQVGLAVTSWELDFFGRIGSLKEAALAQYLATEEARRAAQTSLVAAVASGWYTLLADEQLLKISRDTLRTREESIKLTKLRFDTGVASELDYRQAVSLTEAARATLAQQQRQRALDENALVLLLGQALPADVLADRKSTRLNSSHLVISYAVFCLKKKQLRHAEAVSSMSIALRGETDHCLPPCLHLHDRTTDPRPNSVLCPSNRTSSDSRACSCLR